MPVVYLAGLVHPKIPRTQGWRADARVALAANFTVLDPLRGETMDLVGEGMSATDATSKEIIARDHLDVKRSDILLVNLTTYGSKRPLLGTMFELAWAWQAHTPVIAFLEEDGNAGVDEWVLGHPMIAEAVSCYFDSLSEALLHVNRRYN